MIWFSEKFFWFFFPVFCSWVLLLDPGFETEIEHILLVLCSQEVEKYAFEFVYAIPFFFFFGYKTLM